VVRLEVFDLEGQRVAVLADAALAAGPHEVTWTGRDDRGLALPSGTYVCRLAAGVHRATTRMALLK
jgi:flagellar hook assembly protein FlgD